MLRPLCLNPLNVPTGTKSVRLYYQTTLGPKILQTTPKDIPIILGELGVEFLAGDTFGFVDACLKHPQAEQALSQTKWFRGTHRDRGPCEDYADYTRVAN